MSDSISSSESQLDKTITDVFNSLERLDPESKEYAQATDQLVKLHKLKLDEGKLNLEANVAGYKYELETKQHAQQAASESKRKPVSLDTLALAGANLLGIAIIVWHERDHIMNKNALGFLKALR